MKVRIVLVLTLLTLMLSACGTTIALPDAPDTPSSAGSEPVWEPVPRLMQYDDYFKVTDAAVLESSDTGIVEIADGTILHAVGIGTADITADGKKYTVTVEKAKLSVILCIGQSNMTEITTGNEQLAVKPAPGTAYWKTPGNTGSLSETGVRGLFGAFADQYYKATGEKCLLIPAARGGVSVSQYQTKSDCLGNAIDVYNGCAENLENYRDRYDIVRAGYIWLQGEIDCRFGMTAETYLKYFKTMHSLLNAGCKTLAADAEKPFTFTGILAVRSWSGLPGYVRPDNTVFSGPRAAQYAMSTHQSLTVDGERFDTSDIHLITNITESWYDDSSVSAWFASDRLYYEADAGIRKIIALTEADTDALMTPDIVGGIDTGFPDQHYFQQAYNEMGGDAGYHLGKILMAKDKGESGKACADAVILRGFDGKAKYRDGDAITVSLPTAVLVPALTDLSLYGSELTSSFVSADCPTASVDPFGRITGLKNEDSGKLTVYLDGKSVMTVTVTMRDPTAVAQNFTPVVGSEVYLSDLIGTDECLYWRINMADSNTESPRRTPGKDVNYTEEVLSTAGVVYEKGIGLHPPADQDGVIEFDIRAYGCDRFYAIVGSPRRTADGNGTVCSVQIDKGDGYITLETSSVLGGESLWVFDLDITGAQKIRLTVNNNGDYVSDATTWSFAMIYKNA